MDASATSEDPEDGLHRNSFSVMCPGTAPGFWAVLFISNEKPDQWTSDSFSVGLLWRCFLQTLATLFLALPTCGTQESESATSSTFCPTTH